MRGLQGANPRHCCLALVACLPAACAPAHQATAIAGAAPLCVLQVLKLAKKAAKRKQIKRGVKEVIKALRKKAKGCAPLSY